MTNKLMRSVFALTFTLLFAAQPCWGTVLIQSDGVHPETFAAHIIARPNAKSLVDHLEMTTPAPTESGKLSTLIERAQRAFLSARDDEARSLFLEASKMSLAADWKSPHRRAIFYSFLRLAQLSNIPQERARWCESAAVFAPDLTPDADVFPPPLLRDYREAVAKTGQRSLTIAVGEKFKGYDVLKLNGRAISLAGNTLVHIPPGRHRFSLLSNSLPYVSYEMTASQVQVLKTDVAPLAQGTCAEPGLQNYKILAAHLVGVVYPDNCVRIFTGTSWLGPDAEVGNSAGLDLKVQPQMSPVLSQHIDPIMTKKTWLLVGLTAAIATSVYLIYRHNRKGGDEPPADSSTRVRPVSRDGGQ